MASVQGNPTGSEFNRRPKNWNFSSFLKIQSGATRVWVRYPPPACLICLILNKFPEIFGLFDLPPLDQLTLDKFLDFLKQNYTNIFGASLQETIKKHIGEDLIRLGQEDEIIKKLNNLRDNVLGHFDISVLKDPEKQFYLENEIGDDELERLFKLAQDILKFYSLAFNCSIIVNSRILDPSLTRIGTF